MGNIVTLTMDDGTNGDFVWTTTFELDDYQINTTSIFDRIESDVKSYNMKNEFTIITILENAIKFGIDIMIEHENIVFYVRKWNH